LKDLLVGLERILKRLSLFYVSILVIIFSCPCLFPGEAKDVLDRSLKGIQLGIGVEALTRNSAWKEISGLEKTYFEPNLTVAKNGRIFKMSSGKESFFCEFVTGKCFKIGMSAPASEAGLYLKKFTAEYGQPIEVQKGWYMWEDEYTRLELKEGPRINIFLTDRKPLSTEGG
jgi:hypothetical protein